MRWTQLSDSPHTVHVRWKSVINHINNAAPRAPKRWTTTRPRKGTTRSWGRRGSGCTRGEEYEGSLVRLRCRRCRITGGVGEWRDGLASGWSSRGRRGLRSSTIGHERQEQAARPALLWAAGARRPEVEEARRPLDGHHTVIAARIIYID